MIRNSFRGLMVLLSVLLLFAWSGGPAIAGGRGTARVTGEIGVKGMGPMMNGTVFFIDAASGPPPSATKYWRVPTHAFNVDRNARFIGTLPAGTYYMGAIERTSGEVLGPPLEGDFFFIRQDAKGDPMPLTLWEDSVVDLGTIVEAERFSRASLAQKGITGMEGMIRRVDGSPVEGAIVFAYTTPAMFGRPLFVSERTGKGGKYLLRVASGGTYYIRAREHFGGPPAVDELIGVHRKGKPVAVKTGRIVKGIDITVDLVGRDR